ncbi:MAG: ADP-ribosylation factor-like protein [Vicinamibacteria bacterium]|nr:ADP-ribosylation factor-like protein [Vicinamibacteria bacterium]
MPAFDEQQQRLVVRIVYDGPATAGKTTNLAQLCGIVTPRRRGELRSQGERAGRTLFFDWLQIEGGLVDGLPLRCQLLSVPGQAVLARRRQHVLRLADAVVFVCDSRESGVDIARRMLTSLLEGARCPLVIQANKQDLPGALSPEQLASALGLEPGVRVIPARADRGQGVKETLVLAIRAATDTALDALRQSGLAGFDRDVMTPERLHARMQAAERDEAPSSVAEQVARALGLSAPAATRRPALPTAAAPPGCVWPESGRGALRLAQKLPWSPVDGPPGTFTYQVGDLHLETSHRRHHPSLATARLALHDLARRKAALGPLLPSGTVLCAQPDPAGGAWLWTVRPQLPTLGSWMESAAVAGDEAELARALAAFGDAVFQSVDHAWRGAPGVEVSPSSFGLDGQRVVCLHEGRDAEGPLPGPGPAVLRALDQYAAFPQAARRYVGVLDGAFASLGLIAEPRARQELRDSLASAQPATALARRVRARLVAHLDDRAGLAASAGEE